MWVTELFVYYFVSQSFGEEWSNESYFLVASMVLLIYGMSVYNAPNAGSILLKGNWYSFGIDCSKEYDAIRKEKEGMDAEADNLLTNKDTSSTVSCLTSDSSSSSDLFVSLLEEGMDGKLANLLTHMNTSSTMSGLTSDTSNRSYLFASLTSKK